jgi:uncharacterized membrane protein
VTTTRRAEGSSERAFESAIGRLLIAMTYTSVVFLVIGVGLMAAAGIGPLDGGPALDPGSLIAGLVSLDPAAFLWLGLGIVIATPIIRVAATGIAYARQGQWTMVLVSGAILVVIAIGVAGALSSEA